MNDKIAGLLTGDQNQFMGLLGNPLFNVGMGLLAARQDGRINPYGAAMNGLTTASQFRMLEQDRKREQEELERIERTRELARKLAPQLAPPMVSDRMGPQAPADVAPELAGTFTRGSYKNPHADLLAAIGETEGPGAMLDAATTLTYGPGGGDGGTSAIKNFYEKQNLIRQFGPDSQEVRDFDAYVRANQLFNGVPISGVTGQPIGGQGAVDAAAGIAGTVAGATKQGQNQQDLNYGFVKDAVSGTYAAREGYNLAESMYNTSRQLREQIESGVLDTGPIDSLMYQLFGVGTEELASMNADQVKATLDNLQITNLAPVTVQELRTIAGLWADIAKQEKPNIGVLKRAEQKSLAVMERMIGDAAMQAERVKQYGTPGEYDRLYQTNPFVRMAIEGKAQEGKPDPAQFNTFEEYKAAVQKWQGGQR